MKNFKKILGLLIAVITVLSICACPLSAAAEEFNYGTFEGGMIPDKAMPYYGSLTDGKGFPNGNFEQGLKYWGHLFGKRDPKTVGKIGKEANGNYYFQFATENTWDGLYSVCFTDSRVKVGDSPSLLFRYSGAADIQIILMQEAKNKKNNVRSEKRLAFRTKTIVKANTDDGWNIAVLEPEATVVTPTDEGKQYDDPNIYLNYFIQIREDPTCNTKIDDLQIVNYDTSAGTIKDLDGKLLYNMTELNPPEDGGNDGNTDSGNGGNTDGGNTNDGGNTDGGSGAVGALDGYTPDELIVMEGDYPTDDENKEVTSEKNDKKDNSSKNYVWIIVAAGVVVVLGAAAGIFFMVKAKKNPAPADETEDTTEETLTEETEE